MKKTSVAFLSLLVLLSCGNQENKTKESLSFTAQMDSVLAHADACSDTVTFRYARGLRLAYQPDGIHVYISNPDPSVADKQEEHLVVRQPARRFICTTALQLGNFEILGLEDRIVGINSLRNLFSPRIKEQMRSGATVRIGKEGNFEERVKLARDKFKDNAMVIEQLDFIDQALEGRRNIMTAEI